MKPAHIFPTRPGEDPVLFCVIPVLYQDWNVRRIRNLPNTILSVPGIATVYVPRFQNTFATFPIPTALAVGLDFRLAQRGSSWTQ
jgi:hypothetical protein